MCRDGAEDESKDDTCAVMAHADECAVMVQTRRRLVREGADLPLSHTLLSLRLFLAPSPLLHNCLRSAPSRHMSRSLLMIFALCSQAERERERRERERQEERLFSHCHVANDMPALSAELRVNFAVVASATSHQCESSQSCNSSVRQVSS